MVGLVGKEGVAWRYLYASLLAAVGMVFEDSHGICMQLAAGQYVLFLGSVAF